MKFSKKCPECGGIEIYTNGEEKPGQGGLLRGIAGLMMVQAEVYVCIQCGYQQVYVPERYRDEVRRKYKRHV